VQFVLRLHFEILLCKLRIHGYESYKATSYRLDHLASESLFYIVSPKDIVLVRPRALGLASTTAHVSTHTTHTQ
jgi:hypothetical protein